MTKVKSPQSPRYRFFDPSTQLPLPEQSYSRLAEAVNDWQKLSNKCHVSLSSLKDDPRGSFRKWAKVIGATRHQRRVRFCRPRARSMSLMGHLQTFGEPDRMSAIPPKADIGWPHWDVR
jgi:hypothetical protein